MFYKKKKPYISQTWELIERNHGYHQGRFYREMYRNRLPEFLRQLYSDNNVQEIGAWLNDEYQTWKHIILSSSNAEILLLKFLERKTYHGDKDFKLIKLLLEKPDARKACLNSYTLNLLIRFGTPEIVNIAFGKLTEADRSAVLNLRNRNENNILHDSAGSGEIEILNAVINFIGINNARKLCQEKNASGKLPIHVAAKLGNLKILETLFNLHDKDLDVLDKLTDYWKNNVVNFVVISQQPETLRWVLTTLGSERAKQACKRHDYQGRIVLALAMMSDEETLKLVCDILGDELPVQLFRVRETGKVYNNSREIPLMYFSLNPMHSDSMYQYVKGKYALRWDEACQFGWPDSALFFAIFNKDISLLRHMSPEIVKARLLKPKMIPFAPDPDKSFESQTKYEDINVTLLYELENPKLTEEQFNFLVEILGEEIPEKCHEKDWQDLYKLRRMILRDDSCLEVFINELGRERVKQLLSPYLKFVLTKSAEKCRFSTFQLLINIFEPEKVCEVLGKDKYDINDMFSKISSAEHLRFLLDLMTKTKGREFCFNSCLLQIGDNVDLLRLYLLFQNKPNVIKTVFEYFNDEEMRKLCELARAKSCNLLSILVEQGNHETLEIFVKIMGANCLALCFEKLTHWSYERHEMARPHCIDLEEHPARNALEIAELRGHMQVLFILASAVHQYSADQVSELPPIAQTIFEDICRNKSLVLNPK